MPMWLYVERGIWKQIQNEENRKKCCEAKKYAKRVVYMAMDQKARKEVELIRVVMVMSCLKLPNK